MIKRNRYTSIVLIIVAFVYIWTVFNISKWRKNLVINNDTVSYYSYLPATFIYKDLRFNFVDSLPLDFEGRIWFQTVDNSSRVQKMTMGLSVLYAPFFFIAHTIAQIGDYEANGYSSIYGMFLCLAGLFYGLLGLFVLSKVLFRIFNDKITALTILIIAFGTNFFYYVTNEGEMSHSFSFFLFSIFLYYSIQWNERQSWLSVMSIGLSGGLIVLVRPSNLVAFIIPIIYGVYNFETLKTKINLLLKNWWQLVVMVAIVIIVFSPQLFYWKFTTGNWFYYSYGNEGFFFTKPHIINGLFSYRKGWLIYTPIMLFAIIGILMLFRRLREFSVAIAVFLIVNLYIIFSWWSWWYGGGFGARPLIESYVFLSIPLAVFLDYIFNQIKTAKYITGFLLLILIVLNLFQTLQYRRTIIHWDSMTKQAYWSVFGKLKFPNDYNSLIKTPDYESALKGEPEKKKK
ncbi:MAG: hypothetical protein A2W99_05755 [Bacteroidetes bacterium GWF2_33_16]|nr:MAG: hypothetical protein A2X00_13140 [Bacteroidetes bacterium GWE2_32_14]OFY05191.1 MAG: hypothetical protein A2W99_05755 [Bacteroidetes bacterium GWF2_33_16]